MFSYSLCACCAHFTGVNQGALLHWNLALHREHSLLWSNQRHSPFKSARLECGDAVHLSKQQVFIMTMQLTFQSSKSEYGHAVHVSSQQNLSMAMQFTFQVSES